MLAHHVPRQKLRPVVVPQIQIPASDRDDLVVADRTVTNAFKVLIEHVKVFVRFVELNAEHRRRAGVVPQQIHCPACEEGKERFDQRRIAQAIQQCRLTEGERDIDVIPRDVEVEIPALHFRG